MRRAQRAARAAPRRRAGAGAKKQPTAKRKARAAKKHATKPRGIAKRKASATRKRAAKPKPIAKRKVVRAKKVAAKQQAIARRKAAAAKARAAKQSAIVKRKAAAVKARVAKQKAIAKRKAAATKKAALKQQAIAKRKVAVAKASAARKKAIAKRQAAAAKLKAVKQKAIDKRRAIAARKAAAKQKAIATRKARAEKKSAAKQRAIDKRRAAAAQKVAARHAALARQEAMAERALARRLPRHEPKPPQLGAIAIYRHPGLGARALVQPVGRAMRMPAAQLAAAGFMDEDSFLAAEQQRPLFNAVHIPFDASVVPPIERLTDAGVEPALDGVVAKNPDNGKFALELLAVNEALISGVAPTQWEDSGWYWGRLVGALDLLAWRLAFGRGGDRERHALVRLLMAFGTTQLTAPGERARIGIAQIDELPPELQVQTRGQIVSALGAIGDTRFHLKRLAGESERYEFIAYHPRATPEIPPSFVVESMSTPISKWGSTAQIATLVQESMTRQPPRLDVAAARAIEEESGLSAAEAVLLFAGLPRGQGLYESSFLSGKDCDELGRRPSELIAARDALLELYECGALETYAGAMPSDVARIWSDPSAQHEFARAVAKAFVSLRGRRAPTPAGLEREMADSLGLMAEPATLLRYALDPEREPRLQRDASYVLEDGKRYVSTAPAGYFSGEVLADLTRTFAFLAATLPATHPRARRLPALLAILRARLASPTLVLPAGVWCFTPDESATAAEGFVAGLAAESGVFLPAIMVERRTSWLRLFFAPARIDRKHRAILERLAGDRENASRELSAFLAVTSRAFTRIATRLREAPPALEQWDANPAVSAPELVEEVARTLGCASDSAIFYLQHLALPAPTSAFLRQVLGWDGARLKAAAEPLVTHGLLIKARRERAERMHFLPGDFEESTGASRPIESWKLPLFDLIKTERGDIQAPLDAILPLRSYPELFEIAWRRRCKDQQALSTIAADAVTESQSVEAEATPMPIDEPLLVETVDVTECT